MRARTPLHPHHPHQPILRLATTTLTTYTASVSWVVLVWRHRAFTTFSTRTTLG